MIYVIEIHKEVGINSFNTMLVKTTKKEGEALLLQHELEKSFDTFALRKKTTRRSDGEFTYICIELRREA